MVNYRSKSGFLLSGTQQGKRVVRKEFDNTKTSPRSTPVGENKWGKGFARWIWDFAEFDAAARESQVAIEKIHLTPVHGCTRTFDLLPLTADLACEPTVTGVISWLILLACRLFMVPNEVLQHSWAREAPGPSSRGPTSPASRSLGIFFRLAQERFLVDLQP